MSCSFHEFLENLHSAFWKHSYQFSFCFISLFSCFLILFTGRRFEELDDDLVDCIDLIIDGRYEDDSPDGERRLVGSTNQRIIDVSGRYSGEDWFFQTGPDVVEIDLDGDVIVSNGSNYRCS